MADEVRMVVVDGVRYRPDDAPKTDEDATREDQPAEHKMRQPRKAAAKKKS